MPSALLSQVFEAHPTATYLVDRDVVVLLANRTGRALLGVGGELARPVRRAGDLAGCIHAEGAGCGRADACAGCAVRCSVGAALAGAPVIRRPALLELRRGPGVTRLEALVSASAVGEASTPLVILAVEPLEPAAGPAAA